MQAELLADFADELQDDVGQRSTITAFYQLAIDVMGSNVVDSGVEVHVDATSRCAAS